MNRVPAIAGVVLVAALGRPDGLSAQGSQERDTIRYLLRPVEITVLRGLSPDIRTAAPVTTLSRSNIQDGQLTIGLDEALAVVPGVVVNNRYNFSLGTRIAVRGLGARAAFGVRGVRLLVDDVPLTMPDGQANTNNVELGSAGRIEVLRGPASSLYGNAAGGVIAIQTENPPDTRLGGEIRLIAGDLGEGSLDKPLMQKGQLKLGGRTENADYILSVSRMETDGFRAHSRAEQTALNTRIRLHTNESSRWTAIVNYADAPVGQNPGALPRDSVRNRPTMAWPANVRTGSGEAVSQLQGALSYERYSEQNALKVTGYGLTRSIDNPLPFGYITLERSGGGARAVFEHEGQLGIRELRLTLGADAELQSDERGEFDNAAGQRGSNRRRDQTDRVRSIGPFAQAQIALLPRLELTAGARYDVVAFETEDRFLTDGADNSGERTLQAVSPRIALLYALSERSSFYASASTAFQTPTTTELLNRPPAPGEACCPSGFNPDLDPQRALNLEVGWKGHLANRVRYEVVAFQMNIEDALVPFQLPQVEAREFFRNSGETRHRGIELALGLLLTSAIALEAAYTYSDYAFVDDGVTAVANEGKKVPGVPPHHAFARLRVNPFSTLVIEVENDYTDRYFTNDANTAANASANVIDARVQFEVGFGGATLRPFVALNNVTDEQYNSSVVVNAAGNPGRYYEPAPGRNLYLGVTVGFGGW
jgi:iron complex outermembrane recepter protein